MPESNKAYSSLDESEMLIYVFFFKYAHVIDGSV